MNHVTRALGACVVGFLMAGCSIGPKFVPDPAFPAADSDLRGRKVIVSGFQGARYSISVTQSADIQTLREAIGTRDISPDVAQGLRARGIDAEARVGVDPNMLRRGEVLLAARLTGSAAASTRVPSRAPRSSKKRFAPGGAELFAQPA